MRALTWLQGTLVAAVIVSMPSVAAAQPQFEVGANLTSVTVGLGDNDTTVWGVPSSSFGLLNPGVYGSIFVGPYVAVEPQLGLIWASTNGDSSHVLNFTGQLDYFLAGTEGSSPYVFGALGVFDASDSDQNPKSVGGGIGYRMPVGDRLAFRVDARYTHFTDDGGNALAFGLSIGGVFGR
jgi:hypothetical protein